MTGGEARPTARAASPGVDPACCRGPLSAGCPHRSKPCKSRVTHRPVGRTRKHPLTAPLQRQLPPSATAASGPAPDVSAAMRPRAGCVDGVPVEEIVTAAAHTDLLACRYICTAARATWRKAAWRARSPGYGRARRNPASLSHSQAVKHASLFRVAPQPPSSRRRGRSSATLYGHFISR